MESHDLLQAGQLSEAAACVLISQLLSVEGGGGGECLRTVRIWFCNDNTVGGSDIVDFLLKINVTSKLVESGSVPVCKPGSVFVVLSSSGHLLYRMVKSCVY